MNIALSALLGIVTAITGFLGYSKMTEAPESQALGGFSDPFLSRQLATSPQANYILSTDGTNNSWIANTGGGGGGGDSTLFTLSQNVIDTDGSSTTATTTIRTAALFATSTTINSNFIGLTATRSTTSAATSTNFFSSILTATTGFITSLLGTNATTTNLQTTQFGVGSDYITDLTGTGLSIAGGALTVTNDHSAVTLSGTPDYITLVGQDIVRGTVDISDDTNLTADGTEIVLTGDALSLGTLLTFAQATASASMYTPLFGINSEYFSDLTGTGLQNSSGALTLNATGDWTGTLDGYEGSQLLGTSNWLYNGSRLSPSTTVGIGVFASSTIGNGSGAGGLTIAGNSTTTGIANFGAYPFISAAGVTPTALFYASSTGRGGITMSNQGYGAEPEFRFAIHDPRVTTEYIAFGMSNADSVSPASLTGLPKNDLAYFFSNTGRDVLIGALGGSNDLYLSARSSTLPPTFKLDNTNGWVGINIATTTTPTSTLSVNGDIYYANSIATGTATSVNTIATSILRAPYGASPSLATNGDHAIDSTSDQFKYQSGGATKVLGNGNIYASFTYSTTTTWTGTTTIPLGTARVAETWNDIQCFTDVGTLITQVGDGTNWMNANQSSTTVGTTALTSNNTFTSGEKRYVRVGTPASSPTTISCTISKSLTSD